MHPTGLQVTALRHPAVRSLRGVSIRQSLTLLLWVLRQAPTAFDSLRALRSAYHYFAP
jgi:hypothetical protein